MIWTDKWTNLIVLFGTINTRMLIMGRGTRTALSLGRIRRCKSDLTIPKRASALAASLRVRLIANNRKGGGGGKARNTGARNKHLIITRCWLNMLMGLRQIA
jgi:hypothetical protein